MFSRDEELERAQITETINRYFDRVDAHLALKNDFFVLRDAVEKAANTFNDIKTRSPEGIEAFLEDEKNAIRLGMAKGVDKINRHLSDIRRRMTIITNMPESQMPAYEKAENIRELRELEREILRSVNVKELREMAKI
jgi:hypothetical protein